MSLLSTLAPLGLALAPLVGDDPTLAQRLEKLVADLEEARVDAHVPGMSIAVVKDDEIVLARGFGLADVEAGRAADENTIYPIGSTTKAFTAALVGMLVDEERMDWDDPVTRYLPYFDLKVDSDEEGAACTIRDLLSHRHGFARMGLLWFGNGVTREEILRTAAGAEPLDGFRKGFHYCNVTYLAAGMAAGAADGSSWDDLMKDRLLGPLEMTSSSLRIADVREDPRLAVGYSWDEVDEDHRVERLVEIDNIGPAGSVNSNVLDMAQWVRLQLGRGEIGDMRLISQQRLEETWKPQIGIQAGVSYGMGWMLHERDGHRLVEHGGNIGGFSAEVGFLPEDGVGFVLLTNLQAASIQQGCLPIFFEALMGDWADETDLVEASGAAALDYEEYAGVYVANFASFQDERFEVRVKEGGLALHIPSQQTFDLKDPDDEGRWVFKLTDQVQVSFERDEAGAVVGLVVHQGGFDFEVPREGAVEAEAPEGLERYAGEYRLEAGDKVVELAIVRGHLAMKDGGRVMPFEHPDEEGIAPFRANPDYYAAFELDEDGTVTAFMFHGDAGDRRFERVGEAPDDGLPSVAEVMALRDPEARMAALEKAGNVETTGEVWVAQSGIRGGLTNRFTLDGRFANHLTFGKFGRVDVVIADGKAWRDTPMRGLEPVKGDQLSEILLDHPVMVEGDWREHFDDVRVVRNDELDGRPVHVVRLKKGDAPPRNYWVDAENGDLVRVDQTAIEGPIRVPITITYSDFREIDGIRRAMKSVNENPASGRMVMTFDDVKSGLEFGDELFRLEEPAQEGH